MELISKEKIENNAGNSYGFNLNWGHRSAFKQGAEFAENELQNLAIEFAEWCSNNNYVKSNGDCWIDEHCDIIFENSLLMFEYFVKNVFYSGTSGR
jgi:hypothetical protein